MAAGGFKGDGLRQRLVGGIALLIIGVVAWFWLLSADSPVGPVSHTTQIPPAPAVKPFTVPEPKAPAGVAPIGTDSDSHPALRADAAAGKPVPVAAPTGGATAARPAPAETHAKNSGGTFELDQHGLPIAWAVQVGVFSTQAGADKVKVKLQKRGFKAYTEPYRTPAVPTGVKVFVGPKLSRERAEEQKRAIDAALKVKSLVVRFQSPRH